MSDAVILVGLPGSGKSAVGRALAARLDRPFIDLDLLIERRTGHAPAALIASEGEPPVTVRLVDWADEEGARFGRSLLGSSACAGSMRDQEHLRSLRDREGVSLPDALAAHGVDLDRMTERPLRGGDELARVLGLAQRVGADGPHVHALERSETLAETLEHGDTARLRLGREVVLLVEAGRELHAFPHAIDDLQLAAPHASDQHVEAVRSEIDRRELVCVG